VIIIHWSLTFHFHNHYPLIIFHYYPFLSSDYYSIGHISLWSIIIQWLLFHRSYSIIIQWLLFHHISIIHDIPVIINHDQWIKKSIHWPFTLTFIDHLASYSIHLTHPPSTVPNRTPPVFPTVVPSCGRPAHPPGACERAPWPPACRDAAPRAPFAWAARRVHNGSPMVNN